MDCFAGREIAETDAVDSPVADVFRGNIPSLSDIRVNIDELMCRRLEK